MFYSVIFKYLFRYLFYRHILEPYNYMGVSSTHWHLYTSLIFSVCVRSQSLLWRIAYCCDPTSFLPSALITTCLFLWLWTAFASFVNTSGMWKVNISLALCHLWNAYQEHPFFFLSSSAPSFGSFRSQKPNRSSSDLLYIASLWSSSRLCAFWFKIIIPLVLIWCSCTQCCPF